MKAADSDQRSAPLVSVALCTFNGARYLSQQIESLLSQSYSNIEIVAADDMSGDESAAILHRYAERNARVSVYINQRNVGFSSNFSSVLERCNGTYICPCDQDDIWLPNKVSRLLDAIDGKDLAYCDSEMIDSSGQPLNRRMSEERGMYSGSDPLVFLLTNCISGHAMLFRRSVLSRAQPFPEGIYYDWWVALVAATGAGVGFVDEPLVKFRRHEATVTSFGGVRKANGIGMRAFLEERRRLLDAMLMLQTHREADIRQLRDTLDEWLERGNGWPFLRETWRHRQPLLHVLRPRLRSVAMQALKYLASVGRRP